MAVHDLTVEDLVLYYESMKVDSLTNQRTYRCCIKPILLYFGDWKPREIDPPDSLRYAEDRRTGKLGNPVGDGTIRRELGILMAVCSYAEHHRLITAADLPKIDRPASPPSRDRWLSEEEMCEVLDAAIRLRQDPDTISRAELFLWIAFMTAARKSAILELKWTQIDWGTDPALIHFNVPGARRQERKKRASVYMSDELEPILRRAYDDRDTSNPYVLGNKNDIADELRAVMVEAGYPEITPHILRHTAATHMARRGVPLWMIAGVLGNTLETVARVYAHHCPADSRVAVNQIPSPARSTV